VLPDGRVIEVAPSLCDHGIERVGVYPL
jgi:hypothetical protein